MDAALRNLVRQRAGNRCEYGGIWQEHIPFALFHINHITPKKHGKVLTPKTFLAEPHP